MAITWTEQWGRDLGVDSAEKLFVGVSDGSDSIESAYAALFAQAPGTFNGLIAKDWNPKEVEGSANLWLGSVKYQSPDYGKQTPQQPADGDEYDFEIGGLSTHITHSVSTTGIYVPSGSPGASIYKGIVNFTKEGVEGLDVQAPTSAFSITHVLTAAAVTAGYIDTLEGMAFTTNDATFKGRAIGEVLFVGAAGKQRADLKWPVTFRFERSKNKASFVFNPSDPSGDQITVTGGKKGWEYLWARYEDVADTTVNRIVKKVIEVRVEKIFEASSFSALGIGT